MLYGRLTREMALPQKRSLDTILKKDSEYNKQRDNDVYDTDGDTDYERDLNDSDVENFLYYSQGENDDDGCVSQCESGNRLPPCKNGYHSQCDPSQIDV